MTGLSPHIRGNPADTTESAMASGSIPAHTGEPESRSPSPSRSRVYPRTYGGTDLGTLKLFQISGLSPHIRGNLCAGWSLGGVAGSIPAHTGETLSVERQRREKMGLSPHIRGNLRQPPGRRKYFGSIPAHTGEPPPAHFFLHIHRVYPRTYGGTMRTGCAICSRRGLSPHIRGNRGSERPAGCRAGRGRGLSPHIRGNHSAEGVAARPPGSIPAHTGEPETAEKPSTA